jgi:RHS repeat-associated protein
VGAKLEESGDATLCPFRFPGQYEDAETGLYYNWWRYYDPQTRRYISPDPLGHRGGLDLYDYVLDPTTWIDPSGLSPEPSDTVPANLHMVGNTTEPKGPRPGTDIKVDDSGMVKGQSYDPANNIFPDGKSATVTPVDSGLQGTFHQVPEGTKMPEGLAIVADGKDVGGPHGPGHHTIYPTKDMPFSEFEAKVKSLPSDPKLKVAKTKSGEIKVTTCG